MAKYDHQKIEKKWQKIWRDTDIYKVDDSNKPKFYCLDMFPYPSGVGLHVGHPKGYIATDVFSRTKVHQGYKVLHPMGWDAFGLPAENYAIKNMIHPRVAVEENIKRFKEQLEILGFNYDWSREINTTDPEFYKWTQWIFTKLFEKGLAYQSREPINWCPSCKTGLSMEDLEDGKCERCGGKVEQKPMRQWMLKITDYADRLLADLDGLDWEEQIIEQQRNWIGRSEGAKIRFTINGKPKEAIEVFTTRPDTLFGATFMVLAPEHPLVAEITTKEYKKEVDKYITDTNKKTNLERQQEKTKTGVFTGAYAINPVNKEKIPIWVSDYVLMGYGTGAIMAVPAHDERDYEFAKKFNIPITQVIMPSSVDENNPPRKDKENTTRNMVLGIIHNPKSDKYLVLKWKKLPWTTFVTGGIESGEDAETAIKREILEETGYANVKILRSLGKYEAFFYAEHKNVNRQVAGEHFLLELTNDEQIETSDEEQSTYDIQWLTADELNEAGVQHVEFASDWEKITTGKDFYTGIGVLTNSGEFDGLTSEEAKENIVDLLAKEGKAEKTVSYKMKDWVFSRQRYWGEPIPIVHCEKCGPVAVPESELPLTLPEVESYEPTGTGESPLASITDWVNTTCPKCGGKAKRETDTMPQWAGSSWYYLRYIDPKNDKSLIGKKKEKEWMPVDLYVGGIEHATRHLLYSRFWHKFLYDIGSVSTKEPFKKLIHVGLILASDGRKMSKRWNNVINPDDIVSVYGADALRIYEMFMGPFTQYIAWNTQGVKGAYRFLEKVYSFAVNHDWPEITKVETASRLSRLIKKVESDVEDFKFNTAIAAFMEFFNYLASEADSISKTDFEKFLILLNPFAPHMTEELWSVLGNTDSIYYASWPRYEKRLVEEEFVTIAVQVNGKVRDTLLVSKATSEEDVLRLAKESARVANFVNGKKILKTIYVRDKILSIVTS